MQSWVGLVARLMAAKGEGGGQCSVDEQAPLSLIEDASNGQIEDQIE